MKSVLKDIIRKYLCGNNIHRYIVRYCLMFKAPIDRTCKYCNKNQRLNIHLRYVDYN